MKVLVYPHDLGIGGSQLNAVELAAGVRDLGHEVIVVGRPGALLKRIAELGLEFVELPQPRKRPSRAVASALVSLIDERGIDVVHGYEWPPTLEALWAARLRPQIAVTSTVMSMAVAPFIPNTTSLLVGTNEIRAGEVNAGRRDVTLLEPPVDLSHNDPRLPTGGRQLRSSWGIGDAEVALVAVTRLAHQLKLEGLLTAIDVCASLAEELPVRLVIVGGGPAADIVTARAAAANERAGRPVVVLAGELDDPRPAYAAADVTLGMGGSALRSLAYAKPLVVQGEDGYFKLLTAETAPEFLWQGWYGRGDGPEFGADVLTGILRDLVPAARRRNELGRFGRSLVEQRFSLSRAADLQLEVYQRALRTRTPRRRLLAADLVGGGRYVGYYLAKRWRRARGREASDDFNARPVAGSVRSQLVTAGARP